MDSLKKAKKKPEKLLLRECSMPPIDNECDIEMPSKESESTPAQLFGITDENREFKVPKTSSMIFHFLSTDISKKNFFDILTTTIILLHISIFWGCSLQSKRIYLGVLFGFWRLSYNLGLGLLLYWQSKRQGLVSFFKRLNLDSPKKQDTFANWLKNQLEIKMGSDYKFDDVPLEFNVWLVFRQLVDVVLMCDFVSYLLFTLSYVGSASKNAEWWQICLRHLGGWILVLFNLWVKIDAHRVVKDYAWYWGDFFFKVKQWLIFDGVFEMAPHPMYSIGYSGYYGASLISGSYIVFFASFLAHIMQFIFLSFVENPHIEKTYEKPPIFDEVIRMNKEKIKNQGLNLKSNFDITQSDKKITNDLNNTNNSEVHNTLITKVSTGLSGSIIRADLVGLDHFAFFRPVDFLLLLLIVYGLIVPLFFGISLYNKPGILKIFIVFSIINCIFWVLIRVIGLGYVLKRQSDEQWWTKWFIKRGGTVEEAFQSWKAFYNLCTLMNTCSFLLVAGLTYFWKDGSVLSLSLYNSEKLQITLFRHALGLMFVGLQIWSSKSIYSTLGDFGWFYGDFFLPQDSFTQRKLLYTGVYRYINSPEKVLGQFIFIGIALIAGSWSVFALALFLQILLSFFYSFVVDPHMRKLYGNQIRTDSGVTKTIKRAIEGNQFAKSLVFDIKSKLTAKKKIVEKTSSINKDSEDNDYFFMSKGAVNLESNKKTSEHKKQKSISDLFSKPLFATKSPINEFFKETRDLIASTKTKLTQSILSHELDEVESLHLYSFQLDKSKNSADILNNHEELTYQLGEPIHISWEAPITHSRKDWIGIYPVASNIFSHISSISSQGKYIYIHPDEKLMSEFVKGDCTFTGNVNGLKYTTRETSQDSNNKSNKVYYGNGVFSGAALPWSEGAYEMRLHHGLSHAVVAISKPFTVKASGDLLVNNELDSNKVSKTFLDIVNRSLSVTVTSKNVLKSLSPEYQAPDENIFVKQENCKIENLDLENNTILHKSDEIFKDDTQKNKDNLWSTKIINPLKNLEDPIGISSSLDNVTAKRLAKGISAYFKIDYSPDVLMIAAKNDMSIEDVATHIYEGRCALDAFVKARTGLLVSPDNIDKE
ncbi:hypothetical protein BB561_001515 [Smittium simulii]|uniref:Phosphatidylethanolamine N-methyltransferase n=1 Tax=Smittium simulii TaxID=133385 RepID=A0A2T9YUC3_9FUNG|nr:hypothetical protein BB561_001515 [Smittium simulii]